MRREGEGKCYEPIKIRTIRISLTGQLAAAKGKKRRWSTNWRSTRHTISRSSVGTSNHLVSRRTLPSLLLTCSRVRLLSNLPPFQTVLNSSSSSSPRPRCLPPSPSLDSGSTSTSSTPPARILLPPTPDPLTIPPLQDFSSTPGRFCKRKRLPGIETSPESIPFERVARV